MRIFSWLLGTLLGLTFIAGCGGGGSSTTPTAPTVNSVNVGAGITGYTGEDHSFVATVAGDFTSLEWSFGGGATQKSSSGVRATATLGSFGSYTGSVTALNGSARSAAFPFTFTVDANRGFLTVMEGQLYPVSIGGEADSGAIWTAGSVHTQADYDPGHAGGEGGPPTGIYVPSYVVKHAADGSYLRAVEFGGGPLGTAIVSKLLVDSSNQVYLAGTFIGAADFGPRQAAAPVFTSSNPNGFDYFLMRLNSAGDLQFVQTWEGGLVSETPPPDMTFSSTGDLLLTGTLSKQTTFPLGPTIDVNPLARSGYVLKLNSGGAFEAFETLDAGDNAGEVRPYLISRGADDSVTVAGGFSGLVRLGPNPEDNFSSPESLGFVMRLDPNLAFRWRVALEVPGIPFGDAGAFAGSSVNHLTGQYFLAGSTQGVLELIPPGATLAQSIPGVETGGFLLNFDADGFLTWTASLGDVVPGGLVLDQQGNPNLSGTFSVNGGEVHLGPLGGLAGPTASVNPVAFCARYDGFGHLLNFVIGGGDSIGTPAGIGLDVLGNRVLSGSFQHSMQFQWDQADQTITVPDNGAYVLRIPLEAQTP